MAKFNDFVYWKKRIFIYWTLFLFEGVCVTTVILAPGVRGRWGPSQRFWHHFVRSGLSRLSRCEFQKRRSCCYLQYFSTREVPKSGLAPNGTPTWTPWGQRRSKWTPGGDSLNTTSNSPRYGPKFTKVWSHFTRKLPFQEKYHFWKVGRLFSGKKRPCGECQPEAQGLFSEPLTVNQSEGFWRFWGILVILKDFEGFWGI